MERHLFSNNKYTSVYAKGQLLEAISNAVRYTPSGGTITVEAWRDAWTCATRVKASHRLTCPTSLSALPGRKEPLPGYRRRGVGACHAKGIVEAHGGQLWVESQVGEGSTFSFRLWVQDH
jgi:signal transduction histidine kinase